MIQWNYIYEIGKGIGVAVNKTAPDVKIIENLDKDLLEQATRMYIYLFFCPTKELLQWRLLFEKLIFNEDPRTILKTLNRIHIKAKKKSFEKILQDFSKTLNLSHQEDSPEKEGNVVFNIKNAIQFTQLLKNKNF